MHSFLSIVIGDVGTLVNYVVDGSIIVSHTHSFGYKHIEAEGMNDIAASKLIDGVLYTLEFISLHDRIPTDFRLISPRYAMWVGEALEQASYSQFYTKGVPISVTLEDTEVAPLFYARHSQALQSFKV